MARTEPGRLRIIGGCWRGRRLPVVVQPGLRPTTDRIRETLFNWLTPSIEGSRVLDCFAGSGALGLEAASRGAGSVTMIERNATVANRLKANVLELGADQVTVHCADVLEWLGRTSLAPVDHCFLDPPFRGGLLVPVLEQLEVGGWLAVGAQVYIEIAKATPLPDLPGHWWWLRDKHAGQVRYALARVGTPNAAGR
ncbi:16S rRNA (guanine(966)-N(2))-methyltransferase RsmD [Halochromatium salexigens]|uniref:Ribosomal RNA small subunit methyltransferase D n=1 Tax=Halochromatium salexigens TaxID=49447 RepID=A0AAJ0UGH6_HALSE|nr:16S rRNA (guanine(966)-N(2))-methyltransferase RsmD [Halochromatium salexigens]MBK5931044.1 16S rRNA (guanine(966)-N(2))-methyltransferase RsmD [Halochromatium salexigens]